MSHKPKAVNGHRRKRVNRARLRVLRAAREKGYITNKEAKKIGGFDQAWFHLNQMVVAGVLEHDGYNAWVPVKRKKPGRPSLEEELRL